MDSDSEFTNDEFAWCLAFRCRLGLEFTAGSGIERQSGWLELLCPGRTCQTRRWALHYSLD